MNPLVYNGEVVKDWRGTPICPGATCIYGAQVGRSVTLVEGTIGDKISKAGKVSVNIVRRSYGNYYWSGRKETVQVGPDRLTIVTELPPTTVPTADEGRIQNLREQLQRLRIEGDTWNRIPELEEELFRLENKHNH